MIATIDEFKEALVDGSVDEVSPELFGCFPADSSLYPEVSDLAWVLGSADLYDLLVLNNRYPGTGTFDNNDFELSQRVIDAMQRIVGFPIDSAGNSGSIVIFDSSFAENQFIPTFDSFEQQLNSLKPADSQDIPGIVFDELRRLYAKAAILDSETPLSLYSRLSGISEDYVFENYDIFNLQGPKLQKLQDNITDQKNFNIFQEAIEAYGDPSIYHSKVKVSESMKNFFEAFVEPRLQGPLTRKDVYELVIGVRAVMSQGFDAAPLWTSFGIGYDKAANPLVGKSLEMLTGLERYEGQETIIDNFQYRETDDPNSPILDGIVELNGPGEGDAVESSIDHDCSIDNDYVKCGWFTLDGPQVIEPGYNEIPNGGLESYTGNYVINTVGTILTTETLQALSSDTVSAENASGDAFLNFATLADELADLSDRLKAIAPELDGNLATVIDMAGGVDNVTGSHSSDVIVGPRFNHGRLSVDALDGDDIVDPGRGGSTVKLGKGDDGLVVLDEQSLFGQVVLMDFAQEIDQGGNSNRGPSDTFRPGTIQMSQNRGVKREADKLFIPIAEEFTYSGVGTNLLTVSFGDGEASKTFLLAGNSAEVWSNDMIETFPVV